MLLLDFGNISRSTDGCFVWAITNLLSISWRRSLSVKSPCFEFASDLHYMTLYLEEKEGDIQLSFAIMKETFPHRLQVKLGVMTRSRRRLMNHQGETDDYGYFFVHSWMKLSELHSRRNEVLHDGRLVIYCKLEKIGAKELIPSKETSGNEASGSGSNEEETNSKTINKILEDMRSLLVTGEDSDVIIRVKGNEFRAHRSILRARSPVFKSMFGHHMLERDSGAVDIDDCEPETFRDFLTYVYTGGTKHIHVRNVFSLYATADKYLMDELKEACVSFMKSNMSVETFCDVITLASRHDEKELAELSTDFFCRNVRKIIETAEWATFLQENPKQANALFIKALSRKS